MLLAGREPDDVAGTDVLDRAAFALDAAGAGRDQEGLAERVGVPGGPCPGLERDAGAGDPGGCGRLEEGVDPDPCR